MKNSDRRDGKFSLTPLMVHHVAGEELVVKTDQLVSIFEERAENLSEDELFTWTVRKRSATPP